MDYNPMLGLAALGVMLATVCVIGSYWWTQRPKAWGRLPFAWRFCPGCRSKLVMSEIEGKKKLKCTCCTYVHWDNPIPVAVAVIPTGDGKVVLIRRSVPPRVGKLGLPAGFVETNETPENGAKREAKEESGLDIEIARYIGMIMPPGVNQHLHFFLAKPTNQQPVQGSDASEVIALAEAEIVTDDIAFQTHRDMIRDLFAGKL